MTRWYVFAERDHGAYRLPLLGPFRRYREAAAMLEPVTAAVRRTRPDLDDAAIRAHVLDYGGRGRLDLTDAVDDEWRRWCIEWRVR